MSSDNEGDISSQASEVSDAAEWEHEFNDDQFDDGGHAPAYVSSAPAIDISELSNLLMGAEPPAAKDTTAPEDEKAQAIEKATRRALDDILFQMASEDTMHFTEEESQNLVKERLAEANRDREKNLFHMMHITVLFKLHDTHGKRWASALPNRQEIDAAYP
jgi:hypothetical protein